jgi:phosphatidylglycerol lysyltransferase
MKSPSYWPVRFVSGIVFLNGLLAILEVLYSHLSEHVEMFISFNFDATGRYFGLLGGFLLMYFASQLLLRKRLAWWMAFIGSSIVVIAHSIYAIQIAGLVLPVTTLVFLALYQDLFVVKYELHSVSQGLRLLGLCIIVALMYGSLGFTRLSPRDYAIAHHASILEGAMRTVKEFSLVGNSDLVLHSRRARSFIDSLDILGGVSITFAFFSLFRPLLYRYSTLPTERDRARKLIEEYGKSSEDEFKLWPEDKAYFFNDVGSAVISYRVDHSVAMVLGEPVGPISQWPGLIHEFKQFCHVHDWTVTFIYIPATNLAIFEAAKLRALKIGEDAVVTTATFRDETIRSKHWRGLMNKFNRLEYSFEIVTAPQDADILAQLGRVTKAWLSDGKKTERSFAMGYHDRAYLKRSDLYLVRDKNKRLVAFANALLSHDPKQATIDLMRYRPGTETGVMDYLLGQIILHLANNNMAEFSLGLAPLSGVGTGPEKTLEERVIGTAGRLGVGGFSYEGLRRFKDKFDPRWEARYLVYERGPAGLARTVLAINSVVGE